MRPRLISLNALRNGLLKPRLGSRRCSGIWPPSKPLTATPERAFCPLTPRPAVLPLPEPMPRPTRRRALRAPGRSASSESFIVQVLVCRYVIGTGGITKSVFALRLDVRGGSGSFVLDHADEVMHLGDHAAGHRRIGQFLHPADLVQAEPDQGLALNEMAPRRAAGLLDLDGLGFLGHRAAPYSVAGSPSPSRRRACRVETLMLRRAATERGESCRFNASKVARTML